MIPTPPLILADIFEVLFFIIILIIGAIGWIANQVKENRKASQQEQAQQQQGGANLDDVAARRREELRRQVAARQGQSTQVRAGGPEPTNLSMADRIARARAKAQQGQQVQQARQAQQPQPAQSSQRIERRPADRSAYAKTQPDRSFPQARQTDPYGRISQQDAARRQAQARQQAQQQQQRAQQQAAQQRAAQQASQQRAAQQRALAARQQQQKQQQEKQAAGDRRIKLQRLADPTADVGMAIDSPTTGSLSFDRKSLRAAFIMKEVLDKPVSLRNNVGQPLEV